MKLIQEKERAPAFRWNAGALLSSVIVDNGSRLLRDRHVNHGNCDFLQQFGALRDQQGNGQNTANLAGHGLGVGANQSDCQEPPGRIMPRTKNVRKCSTLSSKPVRFRMRLPLYSELTLVVRVPMLRLGH
jgi:hypothetical protein